MLDFWLLYPRDTLVWVGRDILYALWASVKWILKLGHVYFAEAFTFHSSADYAKISALDELGVYFWGDLGFGNCGVLAGGVEDIGDGIDVDIDMDGCLLARFIEALVRYFTVCM